MSNSSTAGNIKTDRMWVVFWVPNKVRHPYKTDPKWDPNLENYPRRKFVARPSSSQAVCQSVT